MRARSYGLGWGAVVALLACGGSDGSSGGASGTGQCQAACTKCGGDPCADCASYSARMRDEFETALFTCVENATTCSSAQWETCATEAATQTPRRPSDEQFRSACLAKRTSCDPSGNVYPDDYCLSSQVFEASSVSSANDCLAKGCTEVKACLTTIFK